MTEWVQHGERVFGRRYEWLALHIGAILGDDGVLIIDTGSDHRRAGELSADLRRLSSLPVRWVVNTHHHWDHTFGNAVFRPAGIWGHVRCRQALLREGETMRREAQSWDHAAPFDEVVITPPDHTFEETAVIDVGGLAVTLRYLGRGHTDNDIVVTAGETAFAGDLIEESGPPVYDDAYPLRWASTLNRFADLIEGNVIPGHGSAVDRSFVATQRDEIAEVAALAVEHHRAGRRPADAAALGGPFPPETLAVAFGRAELEMEGALR